MSANTLVRVQRICAELATTGQPITFTAVAEHAQIGRATLYRDTHNCAPSSTNTAPDKPTPSP